MKHPTDNINNNEQSKTCNPMVKNIKTLIALLVVISLSGPCAFAATDSAARKSVKTVSKESGYAVTHSEKGDKIECADLGLRVTNIAKRQHYTGPSADTFDADISSPKSVAFSRDGKKFYVNSLEGCKTVVYESDTFRKLGVIEYKFPSGEGELWAKPSGYYNFTHYEDGAKRAFLGKPVESAWSHNGRYLWVPFYRRTFDINAQDPSAVAVIDTRTDRIVRMFETGPLPKMIAVSPDNRRVAVTHWGDNTVGLIDISSDNMADWHHLPPVEIGHRLTLNYSLTSSVNRDSNSGNLLRGTLFSPDSKWLIVSGMAGPLRIIDVEAGRLVASASDVSGVRHLALHEGTVYGSCNSAGMVLSFSLDTLLNHAEAARTSGRREINAGKVRRVKVGSGARTLSLTPDGKYIFVACSFASTMYVLDAATLETVGSVRVDSYPVGLAVSPDGAYVAVTSQGVKGKGGNAVNLFRVERDDFKPLELQSEEEMARADSIATAKAPMPAEPQLQEAPARTWIWIVAGLGIIILTVAVIIAVRRRRR